MLQKIRCASRMPAVDIKMLSNVQCIWLALYFQWQFELQKHIESIAKVVPFFHSCNNNIANNFDFRLMGIQCSRMLDTSNESIQNISESYFE